LKGGDLSEQFVSGEEVFRGGFLRLHRDVVRLPDGSQAVREYVRHPGAVAIVALTEEGRGSTSNPGPGSSCAAQRKNRPLHCAEIFSLWPRKSRPFGRLGDAGRVDRRGYFCATPSMA